MLKHVFRNKCSKIFGDEISIKSTPEKLLVSVNGIIDIDVAKSQIIYFYKSGFIGGYLISNYVFTNLAPKANYIVLNSPKKEQKTSGLEL